jgi:hypothetical protein
MMATHPIANSRVGQRSDIIRLFLEVVMTVQKFERPVSIFVGLGFPCSVATPAEAFELLNDWSGKRGETHSKALRLCYLATIGEADIETAKDALEAFARSRGILAEEAMFETMRAVNEKWKSA